MLAVEAMATRFELVLDGGDAGFLQAAGEEACEIIRDQEERLSSFRRDSLVTHLNRHAGAGKMAVDGEFLELCQLCLEVHRQSHGAFDPAVGSLMEAWGFRNTAPQAEAQKAGPSFGEVELDDTAGTVGLPSGVQLDFGAVGKGWALFLAGNCLREHGVPNALLQGGRSTAVAWGAPPGQAGWTVAIRPPYRGQSVTQRTLRNTSLAVSAVHGRQLESASGDIGHVLDPRLGTPATATALAAAECTHPALADAWSTALLVLGKQPLQSPLSWSLLLPSSPP